MPINWASIIQDAIPAVAQIAGSAAKGRGEGKVAQAGVTQQQDKGALDRYAIEQATAQRALEAIDAGRLDRAAGRMKESDAALAAPGARASNAVRGDLLSRGTKVQTPGHARANVVDFSGGFNLGDLSQDTRQLGSAMSREALMSQMKGTPTPYSDMPAADYSRTLNSRAPGQTALPQDNALDAILNAIATYGGLAGGVGAAMRKPTVAGQLATQPNPVPQDVNALDERLLGKRGLA